MNRHRMLFAALLLSSSSAWSDDRVSIPAGDFEHPVLLDRDLRVEKVPAFAIDRRPVSKERFVEFLVENPNWSKSKIPALFHDGGYLKSWESDFDPGSKLEEPVTHVSWYAARAYCEQQGGYLPSLVQWEYLVSLIRSANQIEDDEYSKAVFGWYGEQRAPDFEDAHFFITGMIGLVNEWVEDYQLLLSNGEKIDFGGGSCGDTGRLMAKYDSAHYATFLRYQSRSNYSPGTTTSNLGFRCAYDLE